MFQNISIRTNIRAIPNTTNILRFFRFEDIFQEKSSTHLLANYTFFGKGNPNESTPKYEGEVLLYPFNRKYTHYELIDKTIHYSNLNRSKKKYKAEFLNMIRNEN